MGTREAERKGGGMRDNDSETEREKEREVRVQKVDFKSLLNASHMPHDRPGLFNAV